MAEFVLNRNELSQYGLLRSQVVELDKNIKEAEDELAELNKYNINVSPVITGMPGSTDKRDKIADFIITLEKDREQLNSRIEALNAERTVLKYEMHKIVAAVNQIPNQQLKTIIKQHYFDGLSILKVAEKVHMSEFGIYKKLDRFFGASHKKKRG